jgi:uncharacterized protein YndB with AHSA1/START domain
MKTCMTVACLCLLAAKSAGAGTDIPPIRTSTTVDADVSAVWNRWTTEEGLRSFFARDARIEPRVDGEFSILFFPGNPPGQRGAEFMRLLAIEAPRRLMFSWNAPPQFPAEREQRTVVEVRLQENARGGTDVTLTHSGWGDGDGWAGVRQYFAGAWEVVLARLAWQFEHGPVDWDAPPDALIYRGAGNCRVSRFSSNISLFFASFISSAMRSITARSRDSIAALTTFSIFSRRARNCSTLIETARLILPRASLAASRASSWV